VEQPAITAMPIAHPMLRTMPQAYRLRMVNASAPA
jgi:hypothetical protein